MSSDITRDDLRVKQNPDYDETFVTYHRIVTDEEFDRLARKNGYFHDQDVGATVRQESALRWITDNPAKALRALLTDECDNCTDGGVGYCNCGTMGMAGMHEPMCRMCEWCHGRDWLPKDGVTITDGCTLQGEPHSFGQCTPEYRLSVPLDPSKGGSGLVRPVGG